MARGSGSGRGLSHSRKSQKSKTTDVAVTVEQVIGAGLVLLAVTLGGASAGGFLGNAALQLFSVALIGWGIVTLDWLPESRADRVPLLFALALVVLMLVQLVPLPPALWTILPGRAHVAEGLEVIGVTPLPWMPLSLNPARTLAGVTAMLPPIAALVFVLRAGREGIQAALWALFAVTVASVLVGMGQISAGQDSALYFYKITNYGSAVGFFSNANHLATLTLIVIPLVAAVAVRARVRSDEAGRATIAWVAAPAVALLALLGLLAAGSLAGLLLVPAALAGAFFVFQPALSPRAQLWLLSASGLVILAAVGVILFSPSISDFGSTSFGSGGMGRPHIWQLSQGAIVAMLPFGAGFGSFDGVFRQFEDPATIGPIYANHAHSDLIELAIEAGVPGMLLLLALLIWVGMRFWKLWTVKGGRDPIACAASVAVVMVLLHSLVDYPLRTSAIAVPFALCLGLMARTPRQTAAIASEKPSGARHLTA